MSAKFCLGVVFVAVTSVAAAASEESFRESDCKRAEGYSSVLLEKVAEGIGVPARSVKFEGAFVGGPIGNCAGLFATPKGPYECALTAYTSNGGKSYFVGVPSAGMISGMLNLCRKAN